ncbi:MAG: DUF1638 domain-containing protein [Candidatus Zipacnadales bacterium]
MRYQLIACEIILREAAYRAALSPHVIDLHFLTKGLHDNPDTLRERVQATIDELDPLPHDAVLLGYCLCSNGTVGLQARSVPLVVPRAHDCITLFLGSKEAYARRHAEKPGTYYYTPGWIERDAAHTERRPADGAGLDQSYEALVAKYGEDNARYLIEFQNQWIHNYTTAAYIRTELGHRPDVEAEARRAAESHGWEFECLEGSDRLIRALIDGEWDEHDFLIVPPGHRIAATYDARVLTTV